MALSLLRPQNGTISKDMRRRVRRGGIDYNSLSPEEQVQYVIGHWEELWTPSKENEEYTPYIDWDWFDDYFIPMILEEVEETSADKYKEEIVRGYYSFSCFW